MKKQIDVKNIKENPENPRYIKDERFDKLVKSIKDFPDMLEKRPLVLDENKMVLGGNMRLKAIKKAGIKKVWVDIAKGWSDDQKKEFIIKDNIGYGEWDWDILANEWEIKELSEWGLDLPKIYFDEDKEPDIDKDIFDHELDTYINAKIKQITLYFNAQDYEQAIKNLEKIRDKENLTDNTQVFKFLIQKYGL